MKTIEFTDLEAETLKRFMRSYSTKNLNQKVIDSIKSKLGKIETKRKCKVVFIGPAPSQAAEQVAV